MSNATLTRTVVEPYLFFGGRCEEALEFYKSALGAEVQYIMRFNESPDPIPEGMLKPGFENKIMHATFHIGESTLMASDGCGDPTSFNGFSLSLAPSEADAQRLFDALAEGGTVKMPLTKTFWSPCYGEVTDKFGLNWRINVPAH